MKNAILTTAACGLSLGISGAAWAEVGSSYVPPPHWNTFNVPANETPPETSEPALPLSEFGSSLLSGDVNLLPLPQEIAAEASSLLPSTPIWDMSSVYGSGLSSSEAPRSFSGEAWRPVEPEAVCDPLFPWFGSSELLFYSLSGSTDRRLLIDAAAPGSTALSTRSVDPGSGLGFDLMFGRYLENGDHALSVNYLNFDPGSETASATAAVAGDWIAAIPAWDNVGYYDDPADLGSDFEDLGSILAAMSDYEVRRDLRFQGLELDFWSFGLGGGRRVSPPPGGGLRWGWTQRALAMLGPSYPRYGFSGLGGALEVPTAGTHQFAVSQGFRWLQIRDEFDFLASGYVAAPGDPLRGDQRYASEAQNDLFGYQLGGRWNYRASARFNLGAAVKVGIYANSVEVDQRIGEAGLLAQYRNDLTPAGRMNVNDRNQSTVLATLGELDLGGGYRLSDAWTIRGGYRITGISGVATTPSLLNQDLYSPGLSARDAANDSLILHGAYAGAELNW